MSASIRSGSSCLLKLVGLAIILAGVSLGGAALMADADASIQVLMGVMALGGLLIALGGGVFLAVGAVVGRRRKAAAPATLSPEQQQLRDSQEFQATRSDAERG